MAIGRLFATPNSVSDGLFIEADDVYKCCIGICFDNKVAPHAITMTYMVVSIEEFDERTITFCIANLDGTITVADVNDPASYDQAAKLTIDRLMEYAKSPASMSGLRSPLGFRPLQGRSRLEANGEQIVQTMPHSF